MRHSPTITTIAILGCLPVARVGLAGSISNYTTTPTATYSIDLQEGFDGFIFNSIGGTLVGSGNYFIAEHHYDTVYAFDPTGTITGLTLSGSVIDLEHIESPTGLGYSGVYADQGIPATFGLDVEVIPVPPSYSPNDLGNTILYSSSVVYGGSATVGNGIAYPSGYSYGPDFSISLSADAIAAANQAVNNGTPFLIVLGGYGEADGTSSVQGTLSGVSLDVQTVPEPNTIVNCALAAACLLWVRRRARKRNRPDARSRPPRGAVA